MNQNSKRAQAFEVGDLAWYSHNCGDRLDPHCPLRFEPRGPLRVIETKLENGRVTALKLEDSPCWVPMSYVFRRRSARSAKLERARCPRKRA